jgi:hypothetical protein
LLTFSHLSKQSEKQDRLPKMVQKKQTNIRQDFFPSGEHYATADVDSPAIAQDGGPDAAGPSGTRRPSLAGRLGMSTRKSFRKDTRSAPSSARPSLAENDQLNAFEKDKIILVDWDGVRIYWLPTKGIHADVCSPDQDDDPENPLNWSPSKKWANTGLLCLMCLCIGLATAAFSPGIPQMTEELGASQELGQLGLALFNFAFAFVPMFLGPLSGEYEDTAFRGPAHMLKSRNSPQNSSERNQCTLHATAASFSSSCPSHSQRTSARCSQGERSPVSPAQWA